MVNLWQLHNRQNKLINNIVKLGILYTIISIIFSAGDNSHAYINER